MRISWPFSADLPLARGAAGPSGARGASGTDVHGVGALGGDGGVRVETAGELTRGELVVDTTAGTPRARTGWPGRRGSPSTPTPPGSAACSSTASPERAPPRTPSP
ncbi:hypothetical protein WDZ16_02010 [Pseudokineococcus marinus]|uniref:Uncharacterized protein n=1 Tax=Pseudokineococcus marinus TaxID=351215 RepID=A0A849BG11_9ACTN|nr:hypothetical protein [Pseudokineococcus marinus]NNH22020.1 hypothetical protein [Pseudokineococcus marinus]